MPTVLHSILQYECQLYCNPAGSSIAYCIPIRLTVGLPTVVNPYGTSMIDYCIGILLVEGLPIELQSY